MDSETECWQEGLLGGSGTCSSLHPWKELLGGSNINNNYSYVLSDNKNSRCFFFQLDIDVGSSTVARGVTNLVLGYLNNLVIEMAFLIQVKQKLIMLKVIEL